MAVVNRLIGALSQGNPPILNAAQQLSAIQFFSSITDNHFRLVHTWMSELLSGEPTVGQCATFIGRFGQQNAPFNVAQQLAAYNFFGSFTTNQFHLQFYQLHQMMTSALGISVRVISTAGTIAGVEINSVFHNLPIDSTGFSLKEAIAARFQGIPTNRQILLFNGHKHIRDVDELRAVGAHLPGTHVTVGLKAEARAQNN